MNYMAGWQIVSLRDLGFSRGLFMALLFHHPGALVPKLYPRRRMDGIVNTAVAGHKTSKHLAVGGIDDSIRTKSGNIPSPEGDPVHILDSNASINVSNDRDIRIIHNAFFFCLFCQELVLPCQELFRSFPWPSHIHKAS